MRSERGLRLLWLLVALGGCVPANEASNITDDDGQALSSVVDGLLLSRRSPERSFPYDCLLVGQATACSLTLIARVSPREVVELDAQVLVLSMDRGTPFEQTQAIGYSTALGAFRSGVTFDSLAPGRHELVVRRASNRALDAFESVEVSLSARTELRWCDDIGRCYDSSAAAETTVQVSGRVTEMVTLDPLLGTTEERAVVNEQVELLTAVRGTTYIVGSTSTGGGGEFSYAAVHPGDYTLHIRGRSFPVSVKDYSPRVELAPIVLD